MPQPTPSTLALRALLRRLDRHERDIPDDILRTMQAQQVREQRERDAAWQAGSQSLVRALRRFRPTTADPHWEDYARLGGRSRYAGSIGLAKAFLAGGGPGGIPKKDLDFAKRVVDRNDPPTQTWELSNLLGDPIAKESEHTVLLALYLAATLGFDGLYGAGVTRTAREYSTMLNDRYALGWGRGGSTRQAITTRRKRRSSKRRKRSTRRRRT